MTNNELNKNQMIDTPYDFEENEMNFKILACSFEIGEEIANTVNSENLHITIMNRLITEYAATKSNRDNLNFSISVLDKNLGASPVLFVVISAVIYNAQFNSDRMVENGDVWLLVTKCLELMQEKINRDNITDNNGKLIKLPLFPLAAEQLNNLI